MRQIVLASNNQGKVREFTSLLKPLGFEVLSLASFPEVPQVVEDGRTFYENARKKAETVSKALSMPALADDSGLVVHYLGGEPGVHSARFAAPEQGDPANNAKLLQLLAGVPGHKRQAHFTAVLAFAQPQGETRFAVGRCFGHIGVELRGEHGFGYDPLFLVDGLGLTMAEISPAEKNRISHRARALQRLSCIIGV